MTLFLIITGQNVLVDTGDLPDDPPDWYDPVKFKRGQDFVRKNFAGITLAIIVSVFASFLSPGSLKVIVNWRTINFTFH